MTEHYADTADEADRIFTAIQEKRIAVIRQSAKAIDTSNPSGDCWHCGESVGIDRRWCGFDCMTAWQKEQ